MKDVVCVTGASGGIGQALLEQLVGRYEVKALFRTKNAISDKWIHRGCVAVWGDMTDEKALSELVTGVRFVFHCAAIIQGTLKESHAVNVEGTRLLARLAAASGCERFVHVSSVAVYGAASDETDYVETAELRERADMATYGRTKLQAEHALRDVARESALEYTILRPTCVYGPNIKPFTLIPINLIRKGLPAIVGNGDGLIDVVYVDDVARALVSAATCPRAHGEAFNIGHETVSLNEFYSHYGRMLNRPARHLPVPLLKGLLRLLQFIPGTSAAEIRKGARSLIDMATNTRRFPSAKARTVLEFTPEVTLPVGMLATELWGKREHLISPVEYFVDAYSPGPIPFSPRATVRPRTELDLVEITRIAQKEHVRIKPIGSLHSLCPIPETDGICIVLDNYNELLNVAGSLVTVQAGMKLRRLNETLARLNLALPILGAITEQTVSGAISTATHGGSIHLGSISDSVESMRIVRADGSILDIDRSHNLFGAAAVSIGLLGVISTVTFRCVPAFNLQSRSSVLKADNVLDEFDRINRDNLYVDMLYYPVTDEVEILAINGIESGDLDAPTTEPPRPTRAPPRFIDTKAARRLRTLALKALAWVLLNSNSIQRWLISRSVGSAYRARTGRSDRVLAFGDSEVFHRSPLMLLFQGMEISVPYEHAVDVIRVFRDRFQATHKFPLMPMHIRCSSRSDLWLSPAYKRDVCWLEFWLYPHSDHLSKQEIHELMKPFQYRFHWGKETAADEPYIKQQYERWEDFLDVRNEWDPKGVFLNRYLEPFFGSSNGTRTVRHDPQLLA